MKIELKNIEFVHCDKDGDCAIIRSLTKEEAEAFFEILCDASEHNYYDAVWEFAQKQTDGRANEIDFTTEIDKATAQNRVIFKRGYLDILSEICLKVRSKRSLS